ncbi:Hypothetical protein I595_3728 [Croceitalea dokdonensis DOKDO 023]|uniref:Uncharacterized protein n=1 Tax=Croceitalea dokdonensis DOKDO 023 TaxID=1300341 RepID=A0A0P7A1B1_9FLAO|nr:Hypothetical protein I595_3728 [Croceitalea dokdonensis DOKDO 023]
MGQAVPIAQGPVAKALFFVLFFSQDKSTTLLPPTKNTQTFGKSTVARITFRFC